MKEKLHEHIVITLSLVMVAAMLSIGTWYVHYNQRELELSLREKLDATRTSLISIAEITDRNGADAIMEATVSDCSRRADYEALLVRLGSLSQKDRLTLQTLSDECGSFYSERKALMVSKFEREYEVYADFHELLSLLTTHDLETYQLQGWKELIELEKTRSTLLTDQKNIQDNIISALITGELTSGTKVRDLVRSAQDINDLLVVQDKRIDEKRSTLMSE